MRSARASAVLLFAAASSGAAAEPSSLTFEKAFTAAGEPAFLHYKVMFVSKGAVHRMAIWRDHDRRLKRATDTAITSFATHTAGDPAYQLVILDNNRRISTRINRTDMYRIGAFTDWFDLTHGLRHPKGAYRLAAATAPAGMPAVPRPCDWFDLTEGARVTHICWQAKARIPELIAVGRHIVWRVTAIDEAPIAASVFAINDAGYIHNDADRDIDRD